MGMLRSWAYRFVYPLPQKGEDLLLHKEKFIEEYVLPYQFKSELKEFFLSSKTRADISYVKNKRDAEQKAHIEAYKTWRKIASVRQRG